MRNFLKVKFSNASITFMVFFFPLLLAQTETMVKLPGQNKEKSYKKYLENLCSDQRRNHCCQSSTVCWLITPEKQNCIATPQIDWCCFDSIGLVIPFLNFTGIVFGRRQIPFVGFKLCRNRIVRLENLLELRGLKGLLLLLGRRSPCQALEAQVPVEIEDEEPILTPFTPK